MVIGMALDKLFIAAAEQGSNAEASTYRELLDKLRSYPATEKCSWLTTSPSSSTPNHKEPHDGGTGPSLEADKQHDSFGKQHFSEDGRVPGSCQRPALGLP